MTGVRAVADRLYVGIEVHVLLAAMLRPYQTSDRCVRLMCISLHSHYISIACLELRRKSLATQLINILSVFCARVQARRQRWIHKRFFWRTNHSQETIYQSLHTHSHKQITYQQPRNTLNNTARCVLTMLLCVQATAGAMSLA